MSFLVSFEVVEIIFFFLDFEPESFSSSRFLFWEAAGKVGVDRRPGCCRLGAGEAKAEGLVELLPLGLGVQLPQWPALPASRPSLS